MLEGRINEVTGERPSKEAFEKAGEFGLLASRIGPGKHLAGRRLPGDVKPEQFGRLFQTLSLQTYS